MYIEEMLRIYNQDGTEMDMESLSLFGLKLAIPAPSWVFETVNIEGMPGERVVDRTLGPRNLTAHFYTKSNEYIDSLEVRNDIYAKLMNGKDFYIGERNVSGKRWKVRPGDWSPERLDAQVQRFEIPLVAESGTSETVRLIPHIFTNPNISFNNLGDRPIDMKAQDETEIIFKGLSTNLQIRNKTTGETWKYEGETVAEDTIVIKGVRSTKNGESIFGKTNRKMLTFIEGWNELEVIGATDFSLTIKTRFYFL